MRIAQIAPLYEAVPPRLYGGTERVIACLCDELVDRGHEVTLFAAASSDTLADLEPVSPALRERMSKQELAEVAPHLHLRMLADVYARAHEFDIVHSHLDVWTLPFASEHPAQSVLTLHGRLDVDFAQTVLPLYPTVPLVSVSDHQRTPLAGVDLRWAGTVHNGLDLDPYLQAEREEGDHLLFVGRISPEKGPTLAVDVAQRVSRRLRIAAKVDPFDLEYFEAEVEPAIGAGDVEFVGEVGEQAKPALFAGASATLFPSDWPEPFGLVMVESMAAGTPVIALRRGAVPEVVVDGVTGFICDDVDEMVAAVARLPEIDPADCRARARRFTDRAMADRYEAVYRSLVAAGERTTSAAGGRGRTR
jgi:glycosyltransferase involved in cell wall biosynthesis